jgi:hypothetical protein
MLARDSIANPAEFSGAVSSVYTNVRVRWLYPRLGLSVTVGYFGFGHRTPASTDLCARLRRRIDTCASRTLRVAGYFLDVY